MADAHDGYVITFALHTGALADTVVECQVPQSEFLFLTRHEFLKFHGDVYRCAARGAKHATYLSIHPKECFLSGKVYLAGEKP